MKKKDVWIVAGVLVAALSLLFLSRAIKPKQFQATLVLEGQPLADSLPEAESYLRIQQGKEYYHLIPLLHPQDLIISQPDGKVNVIHIDKNMAYMKSSNCPNQDCIHQGVISLENYEKFFLHQSVICLPNKVSLELIPREDALQYLEDAQ